ncbi:MAG TPA: hypothetical protein VH988_31195 [Thermoanaerobaculia bacterium]|jgi:hypothetical protein|nr:hypothetical protein [Thermoanaerobaculia bacterium]
MDESTQDPGELQFDRVEPARSEAPAAFACSFCSTPLYSSYYEINGRAVCEACRYRVEQQVESGAGAGGFGRAALAGLGAAAVGSGLYYGVRALTGYEIGLVAILVGFMVGKAVRWGTLGRGGRGYQVLAVFLTYMSISSTYLPVIFKSIAEGRKDKATVAAQVDPAQKPAAAERLTPGTVLVGLGALFLIAAAGPILAGTHSPILLLIVGFGLWEAWKLNRRFPLTITGPLQVGRPGPAMAPVG